MRLHLDNDKYIETEDFYDLSIPLRNDNLNPRAWYVDIPKFEPVRANGFVGSVKEGGSVNFRDIFFNPHGHGTHTECLGHITETVYSINETMRSFFCKALVISIQPREIINPLDNKTDHVIELDQLMAVVPEAGTEAVIIRTLPNDLAKRSMDYSSKNAPYLNVEAIRYFDQYGIKHLLIDTPSVDREEDGGELAFHHAFWRVPQDPDHLRTITEMVFVPTEVVDDTYILNLQVAAFENDAAPSRPVIHRIHKLG